METHENINLQERATLTQCNFQDSLLTNERSTLTDQIVQSSPETSKRLDSLDIYRGLTMMGMILVDNMGPSPPWFLDHAAWNGLTPADLIFPSFLFIMGFAVPLAVSERKPVTRKQIIRIIALFSIGVLLNLTARKFTFNHFRIMGILQRISLCYLGVLIIHINTSYGQLRKRIYGFVSIVALLLLYLIYMLTFDKPEINCPKEKNLGEFCNFSGFLDRKIFGQNHMIYPNDPEGLFSTLSALFTSYVGYLSCLVLKDFKQYSLYRTLKYWFTLSLIMGIIVYPLTKLMPLNKKIYSISFTFLTSSTSCLTLLFFVFLMDILPKNKPRLNSFLQTITKPLLWLGRNPLFVFVFMDLLAIMMIKYIKIKDESLWALFYKHCFSSWIGNKQIASTAFAGFFLIFWTLVACLLYWKRIFLKL